MQGYWRDDSGHSWHEVSGLSRATSGVGLDDGGPAEGIGTGQWFRAVNVLEELDQPGEWWVDAVQSKLVLLPATEDQLAQTELAVIPHGFMLEGTQWTTIAGLRVEATRSHAVSAVATTALLLDEVEIGNPGGWGVRVVGGKSATLQDIAVRGAGEGGILLSGGDRATLVAAEHVVRGAIVSEFGRVGRMSSPGIRLEGVGSRVTDSTIEAGAHAGIEFTGNDHRIDNTMLRDLCRESGSSAAIVGDGDWTTRGTVIENNTFQHIRPVDLPEWAEGVGEPSAVRLASGTSGTTVSGNTILDAAVGILVDGGRDNAVVGNTFTGTQTPVRVRAVSDTEGLLAKLQSALSEASFATTPTWLGRYPQIAGIVANAPSAPLGTTITANRATDRDELLDASVAARSGIAANQVNYASNGDETPLEDLSNLPPTDSASPYEGLVFYVATNGNDAAAGTAEAPFATIARARDAIRAATGRTQTGGPPPANWKGARVVLESGEHFMHSSVEFDERDSGTEMYPVIYTGATNARTTLAGSRPAPSEGWVLVTNADNYAWLRLPFASRGAVYVLDVDSLNVDKGADLLGWQSHYSNWLRLIDEGQVKLMSRFPAGPDHLASSWMTIAAVPVAGVQHRPATVRVGHQAPSTWNLSQQDVLAYGTWVYPYNVTWERVTSTKPSGGGSSDLEISARVSYRNFAQPGSGYENSRYIALRNAIEALTPGTYVWNKSRGRLYYWTETGQPPKAARLTVARNLLKLGVSEQANRSCDWVSFVDLTFEGGRDAMVRAYGSTGLTFERCEFRNFGEIALVIHDGSRTGLRQCRIYNGANRAMILHGGDKRRLVSAENYIEGLEVSEIGFDLNAQISVAIGTGRVEGSDYVPVEKESCGLVVSNLHARNLRDGAFGMTGAKIELRDSVIDRSNMIVGDAASTGGAYRFGMVGNAIRRTHFKNIQRMPLVPISLGQLYAVYLDAVSGWVLEDNIFEDCDSGILIAGSKNMKVLRNKFINCHANHQQAPLVLGNRSTWAYGYTQKEIEYELSVLPLHEFPWKDLTPGLAEYRKGGALNGILVHFENIEIRDNMTTNAGSNLVRLKPPDVSDVELGRSVGVDLGQLNYPAGAVGVPVEGGGTVPLSSYTKVSW
ncbi:right-handed parallel beta-helix repeat-containing protein [Congregicoccus parvus]|uniref:right-handed parallel beta-helix repeat-containing protein n=1 Tax=Congregicoccus parvus TaxID=3081749 RepID=UPI003FA53425